MAMLFYQRVLETGQSALFHDLMVSQVQFHIAAPSCQESLAQVLREQDRLAQAEHPALANW